MTGDNCKFCMRDATMTAMIKILSDNLVNQIAAGEVVERPASAIKELVENSLDAGADVISVDVKNGGAMLITVTDNGCGMSREDCELSLQRHATSKIGNESDLWKISTMGFRGEALPSISSVSKMTIKSRRAEDVSGTQIDCDGGEIITLSDCGMAPGTIIEVRNLFFNTPARQKYLKQEGTEFGHISWLLNTLALARPDVAFKLSHNGKTVMDLPKASDLFARISDVFSKTTADAMLPIFYGGSDFQIDGFIGKPLLSRSTGQHQYFFVNGRFIQHHLLANRIKAAYHSMLMENKKPVFVINIKIDPSLIDVNVHPRKIEIRFEDQESLVKVIYGAVKTALEKTDLTPLAFTESRRYMSDNFPQNAPRGGGAKQSAFGSVRSETDERNLMGVENYSSLENFAKPENFERPHQSVVSEIPPSSLKSISQIANSYIVAQNDEGLVLIDQHAAHERVRFEQLWDQFENQKKSVQPLLVPEQLEFSGDEIDLMNSSMDVFAGLGFEIEHFGGNSYVVHAVPGCLSGENISEIVKGVLDDIMNGKDSSNIQGEKEKILTYMSCRSAIKFGQKLSMSEMEALILQMENLKRPYTCPHGRPTMIKLTLSELERMFGRK